MSFDKKQAVSAGRKISALLTALLMVMPQGGIPAAKESFFLNPTGPEEKRLSVMPTETFGPPLPPTATATAIPVFLCDRIVSIKSTKVRMLDLTLTPEQLDVLALLVYGESSSGQVPLQVSEWKVWALLNRLSHSWYALSLPSGPGKRSVYNVWRGAEEHLLGGYYVGDAANANRNRSGVARDLNRETPGPATFKNDAGRYPLVSEDAELAILYMFIECYKSSACSPKHHTHYMAIREAVDRIYPLWREHGANSAYDPTHGAVRFSDVAAGEEVNRLDPVAMIALQQQRADYYARHYGWHPYLNYFITGVYRIGDQLNFTSFAGCPDYAFKEADQVTDVPVCPLS